MPRNTKMWPKINKTDGENLHNLVNFNEIFTKYVTCDNIKSHKKLRATPIL